MIYLLLFWEFAKVAIFCVGGGYASMPLIQSAVVDTYHWMSLGEFVDIFTISQMTPGPIGINAATFAGQKIAGFGGAVCATVGFCTPSLIIGIALTRLFFSYGDIGAIRGILNGLRPAVVALIAAAGISFVILALWNVEKLPEDMAAVDPLGVIILAGSLAAVRRKVGVIKLLAGTGVAGLVLGLIQQSLH